MRQNDWEDSFQFVYVLLASAIIRTTTELHVHPKKCQVTCEENKGVGNERDEARAFKFRVNWKHAIPNIMFHRYVITISVIGNVPL